ncbi:MAG: hypothetical protein SGI77_00100 [Pirellulaceae bacterium]|nr:hypothetical protein [Pirellulaceae bacterium]
MDELDLQRLTDGELDHATRRQLLRQLDNNPSQWRGVALALIEEQEFRRQLGLASTSITDATDVSTLASAPTVRYSSEARPEVPLRSKWLSMALAASFLIGVGAMSGNWMASQWTAPSPSVATDVGPTVAVVEGNEHERLVANQIALKPVGQLSFPSDTIIGSNVSPVKLPMYEAAPEQISQILQVQNRQLHDLNEQMRRRGFELDWQHQMLESQLPDGRAVIVPIQEIHVRSVGQ